MNSEKPWAKFFDGHAPHYDENCFTRNTIAEVQFLTDALGLAPGSAVLDVGCGTGRHAVELARLGYRVTGLDLSAGMLDQAKAKASAAGVRILWRHEDATTFEVEEPFDGVICLCEGGFGLLGPGDDAIGQPLAILRRVAAALRPSAKCLFTLLNALAMARRHSNEEVAQNIFDPLSLAERSDCLASAVAPDSHLRERGFVPTELILLCEMAGLQVLNIWGGTAGNWGRRKIDLDEMEIMVLARRGAAPDAAPTGSPAIPPGLWDLTP